MPRLYLRSVFDIAAHSLAFINTIELLSITFHLITVSAFEVALTVLYLVTYVAAYTRRQHVPRASLGAWRMWASDEASIEAFVAQMTRIHHEDARHVVTTRCRRWRVSATAPFLHYGWFVRVDLLKREEATE